MQVQHLRGMLFLNRRPSEQWAAWQIRTLRLARIHLQRNNIEGWSSFILKRIWSLWGHMARGGAEVNSMVTWKNMHFWRVQLPRRQRVTHASRFNPEADVERAIEAVAGTNWGMLLKTDTELGFLLESGIKIFGNCWSPWLVDEENFEFCVGLNCQIPHVRSEILHSKLFIL